MKTRNTQIVGQLFVLVLLPFFIVAQNMNLAEDRSFANRLEYLGIAVEQENWNPWGSSPVIGPDGKTHLFVARWPISEGFGAWKTHCEIARYVGDSPDGPFVFKEVIVKGGDEVVGGRQSPHNPNIKKVGDKYVLTFITNSGAEVMRERVASQSIEMLVAEKLEGPWKSISQNSLIFTIPEDPEIWSHGSVVGVTNPAFLAHPDGRFFLYYKAMRKGDVRRMGVAIANKLEGPYVPEKNSLTSNSSEIEDGYAFIEDGEICLLTTHNKAGTGYLWKSEDGLHFNDPIPGFDKMNEYVSQETIDNTTRPHGALFGRPKLLIQNGRPTHLYVASGVNFTGGKGTHSCVLRIHDPKSK